MRQSGGRTELLAGVGRRQAEICAAILARVHAVDVAEVALDAEYLDGVRSAVETAIDHTICSIRSDDDQRLPVPAAVLEQTRLAARRRTPLDRVLRRYLAGHSVLSDYIVEEAQEGGFAARVLRQVLRSLAVETDRMVAAISDAYRQEMEASSSRRVPRRLTERVRRLLAGELLDTTGLGYQIDCWHVGLVAYGDERRDVIQEIVGGIDAARLVVEGDDEQTWAWVGMRVRSDLSLGRLALSESVGVGVGEPGRGSAGWRLTHEQAKAALTVAARGGDQVTRYADVALLASAIRDELLTRSLKSLYVAPLDDPRDGKPVLKQTLRAYLWADRNVTSTAAALGVSRNTVHNRLRTIEAKIGQLKPTHFSDLVLALQLEELTGQSDKSS
jgi:hypothetical protein